MNQGDLLTVAEVAERCGKSKQAIYSRMSTTLQPFVQVLNGKKYLHISVLEVLDSRPLFKDSTKVEQPLIDVLKEQLDLLQRQLEVKDKQIEELNKRLEQSLNRNYESNVLIAQTRALEASGASKRTPWYKRLFKSETAPVIEE